jgi:hypothetical protein
MAKSITRRTLAGYNKNIDTNIIYIEDLVRKLQKKEEYKDYNLKDELLEKFNIEDKNMKFSAVVGNPPYQDRTEGESTQMPSIYNLFMEESYTLSDKVCLITPARFLFNAGSTPENWNLKMLSDEHIKILQYFGDSSILFPNTDIKGGVVITYRDKNINFGAIGVFTLYPELNSIREKIVNREDFIPLSSIIYLQNKFILEELLRAKPHYINILGSKGKERRLTTPIFEKLDIFSKEKKSRDDIKIAGLVKNKRTLRWIENKFIEEHPNLDKYKVVVTAANGSGKLGEVLSNPEILEPFTGFTFSFISFGAFQNLSEAQNLLKYIKTKFSRSLLAVLKITQHNFPKTWSNIPLQDFTEKSDIDWSASITEIDQILYKKYNLNQKEIDFIEKNVKPMN